MHELCALLDANIVNEFSDFACLYITNFGGILAGLCDLPEEALMGEWFALVQRLRRCLVRASGVLRCVVLGGCSAACLRGLARLLAASNIQPLCRFLR